MELLAKTSRPEVISFAVGMPARDLFPASAFARACSHVLTTDAGVLQYGIPSPKLLSHVVDMMASRGVACQREQVFLTTGAQQGMDLLARLLITPGDSILIENTVFEGIRLATRTLEPRVLTVPTDAHEGIDVEAIEKILRTGVRPAFCYLIPEGHNPLGLSLSVEKRERLVSLARRYGMPLLEDDAYGFLSYSPHLSRPLRAMEGRWVFYLGSFSKILAPGLRVGWLVVPEQLLDRLSALKHGMDLDTSTLTQHVLARFLDEGNLDKHVRTVCDVYRQRRDALLVALDQHFGAFQDETGRGARWAQPQSGLYVWLELPVGSDATAFLNVALENERVAFTPGRAFAGGVEGAADRFLRLSFGSLSPEQITAGIVRLRRAFDLYRATPETAAAL